MKLIEQYTNHTPGYDPCLIRDRWQAALLNYSTDETLESITKLDIHYRTDEVFVLLAGHAVLIAADIDGGRVTYEAIDMQPNVIYNIPGNVWHKIAMQEDSQVLIVENSNTHLDDFAFYDLSPLQKEDLVKAVTAAETKI